MKAYRWVGAWRQGGAPHPRLTPPPWLTFLYVILHPQPGPGEPLVHMDLWVPLSPRRGGSSLSGWSVRPACAGASAGRPLGLFRYTNSHCGNKVMPVRTNGGVLCRLRGRSAAQGRQGYRPRAPTRCFEAELAGWRRCFFALRRRTSSGLARTCGAGSAGSGRAASLPGLLRTQSGSRW